MVDQQDAMKKGIRKAGAESAIGEEVNRHPAVTNIDMAELRGPLRRGVARDH